MGSESSAETVFLGWEEMPLVVATRWLLKHKGSDLSQVVVALPGARSGRLLLDCLAREAGKALRPPEIVTAGALSDFLLELDGTPAGRLSRTLAWARALRTLDARQLRRIVARPPEDDDFSAWWRLAEEVRSLFGEMAAEGLEFSAVASDPTLLDQGVSREGERQRWHALAAAQKEMSKLLAAADLVDPHLGRWQAIENENQAKVSQIVLIGVVEASALLRRAIELSSASCTALVFAPNGLAQTFDNLGCLIASEWSEQSCSCSAEQWKVVDSPADQAQAARDEIAQWQGAFSAEQISIGLGNPEAGPFVKRALSNERIVVRDAAGETLKNSSPARLLVALGRFLDSERFLDFTGLLRHVDYEHCLRSTLGNIDPVATADTYFTKHLPDRINGEWLAKKGDKRDEEVRNKIASVWKSSEALLAGLRGTGKVPTMQAVAGIRTFLETLYDGRSFDLNEDAGRRSFSALEQIGKHLSEIESLPAQFLDDCTIAEALALLERLLQGSYLPPVAAQEGEATIEMLGWLELSLDNAPALVVLGFEDGHVPESVRGDAYLPNSLRKSLGILDDEQRLARDIYASELL
ncbi:MAG: ATP-dependent helicase/nuclease subunit B, partial [Candidatus Paceibacteria bacterium]